MISTNSQISWSDPLIGLLNNLLSGIPDTRHSLREYTRKYYITALCANNSPSVIDLEHFIESFLALLSNQVPSLWPPVARLAKVFDFCRVLISMWLTMCWLSWCWHGVWTDWLSRPEGPLSLPADCLRRDSLSAARHTTHTVLETEGGTRISDLGGRCAHHWDVLMLRCTPTDWLRGTLVNQLSCFLPVNQSVTSEPASVWSVRQELRVWVSLYRSSQLSWGSTEKPPRRAAENRFWG